MVEVERMAIISLRPKDNAKKTFDLIGNKHNKKKIKNKIQRGLYSIRVMSYVRF